MRKEILRISRSPKRVTKITLALRVLSYEEILKRCGPWSKPEGLEVRLPIRLAMKSEATNEKN